jgi:hypothetical protein
MGGEVVNLEVLIGLSHTSVFQLDFNTVMQALQNLNFGAALVHGSLLKRINPQRI